MRARHVRLLGVVLVLATSAACYEAPFPLDGEPQADLDPALLGVWACHGPHPGPGAPLTLRVARGRDRVYAVSVRESGEAPDRYEAHASLLGEAIVLNVHDLGKSAGTRVWTFARYRLSPEGRLEISLATSDGMRDVEESPAAVRAALAQAGDRPGVFEPLLLCQHPGGSPGRQR
jgi:hypothetical protein